jgi:hypothetical protein
MGMIGAGGDGGLASADGAGRAVGGGMAGVDGARGGGP